MLHPDYQYDATRIPALVAPIAAGTRDLMLGSRFLGDPLAGGMPRWKYISNRFLTGLENLAFGLQLSEYHTGLRAYSRHLLETVPYNLNSDDFVFDQELIAQAWRPGWRRGSARSPSRPATSTRRRRSASGGASSTAVDAASRGALPAPSTARPPLAEALRSPTGLTRPMSISRNALLRGARSASHQRHRDLDPDPVGRHRGCVRCPADGSRPDRGDAGDGTIDVAARGARWRSSWRRSRHCHTGGSSATRTSATWPTTSCPHGSASCTGATRWARARASAGRRSSAPSSSNGSSAR